jgi:hypothetical protein
MRIDAELRRKTTQRFVRLDAAIFGNPKEY